MKLLALIAVLAVAAAVGAFLLIGPSHDRAAPPAVVATSPEGENGAIAALRASVPLPHIRLNPPPDRVRGPSFPIATVKAGQTIAIHESPGGRVVDRVGDRTEFGSIRVYWIEKSRAGWFGVPSPDLPDGQLAWIRDNRLALTVSQTHFWISADLSTHRLELHHGNRLLDRFPVTVGSSASPTPLGNYSVTDGLVGRGLGPWYGCCVLALTGHQSNLPSGWIGGDRIAIHGTPGSIGGADSHGCLRASDPDMVSLFARVPLGAPVFIHS
jgi:hypothetical protein